MKSPEQLTQEHTERTARHNALMKRTEERICISKQVLKQTKIKQL